MDSIEEYTKRLKAEYEKHLLKYDPNSPETSHWIGKEKLWLRFDILTQIDSLHNKKVLDFGCGNSLLLDFLKEKGIECEYYGWDISERMIDISKRRHPKVHFKVCDVLEEDTSNYSDFFDYIIINGVFNIKVNVSSEAHGAWVKEILRKLWPLCKHGITASFLTEYVDWTENELYYSSIKDITSFCVKNLSRWFVIRHDYQLWEFTIYIYKQPRVSL